MKKSENLRFLKSSIEFAFYETMQIRSKWRSCEQWLENIGIKWGKTTESNAQADTVSQSAYVGRGL